MKKISKEGITFEDVMNLGFNVEVVEADKVFYKRHGFYYKIVTKTLIKTNSREIIVEWEQLDKKCRILNCDKDANIKRVMVINDAETLKEFVEFFK